jgi:hypothetical protein
MKRVRNKYLTYFLLAIVLILFLVVILREPNTHLPSSEVTKLKNSITKKDSLIKAYQQDAVKYEQKALIFTDKIDSLIGVKQKVKIKYREIYIDIDNARNEQLDSIIRTNW